MRFLPPRWVVLLALSFLWPLEQTLKAQQTEVLSAIGRSQIAALEDEKAARTPPQIKMDSRLVHLVKKHRGEKLGVGLDAFEGRLRPAADGFETVDISATVTPELLAAVRALGGTIINSVPRFRAVRARLPLAQMEALAARPDVAFVKPAVQAMTHAGPVVTEGDIAHRANTVRSTPLNATGRGLKIGVISDSVDSLTTSQSTGELGVVTSLPGQSGLGIGGTGEGTAMLEIVHDLAPDAQLFFATAFLSEAGFAQNILDLRAAGCDIIVDDVGYFDESPFQDGPVAQAANEIVADGGLYFSAAGNEGNKTDGTSGTWEGDFLDGGASGAGITKAGRLHSFGAANYNTLTAENGYASLFWADPAGASANDYDLYVFSADGNTLLSASTNVQNGRQDPYEITTATTVGARIVIVKSNAAQPRFLHLNTLRGRLGTSTSGTIQGHAAAAGVIAVAATSAAGATLPFTGSAISETFTTDGSRRVFFQADGTAITPGNFSSSGGLLRAKPDMTGADGVKTSLASFNPFYGTSAAAPHAAAIAALVWSRNRALNPQQVRTALTTTATDIETAGADRDTGVGIANALAAAQSVTGGAIISPTITITAESYAPANGRMDPGETFTVNVALQNIGASATGNLVATLETTGGVYNPSAPQSYGALGVNASASRSFTFQGNGLLGSTLTATFVLSDGAVVVGNATATYTIGTLGAAVTFTNAAATTIPSSGTATPYPSNIAVSGLTGSVGKVTVTLTNFTHSFPADVDILLVSPSGRRMVLMSDAGAGTAVTNVTLTFDDAAAAQLGSSLTTGTYKPTPLESLANSLPAPAPAAPYQGTLSSFVGDAPNGTWQLFVRDQFSGDSGSIGSWTLRISPDASLTSGANADLNPVLTAARSSVATGTAIVYTATVYNLGAAVANSVVLTDTLPASTTFVSATTSAGTVSHVGNAVTASIGTIARGGSAVVTVVATANTSGMIANTVSVALTGSENSAANNASSVSVLAGQANLTAIQPPGWSGQTVVSTVTGTNSDTPIITAADPVFLDFATSNSGTVATSGYFVTELYVDGVLRRTFDQSLEIPAGGIDRELDVPLGTLAPGLHTIVIKSDTLGTIAESNENDNTLIRTLSVAGPNLTPTTLSGYTDKIVVGKAASPTSDSPSLNANDPLFAAFGLANTGNAPTGVQTVAELYLDGGLIAQSNISAALASGVGTGTGNVSLGALAAGVHTLRLVVDASALLLETDETDNAYVKTFVVNALPTITAVAPQVFNEDTSAGPVAFTIGDAETLAGSLTVSATSNNDALLPSLVLSGSGSSRAITLAAAPNLSGSATVTVTVADGSGGMAATSFLVTVVPVNDPPSFAKGIDLTVAEDAGAQILVGWATGLSKGPADESGQTLTFNVATSNPALFAVSPAISANGTLSYTPAPDANGAATGTVSVSDNGGGADTSAAQTFTISVSAVNDAPSFSKGADVVLDEDSGAQTLSGWATAISAGPGEIDQALTFLVSSDNAGLFSVLPAISANGALTFTPAANAVGSAAVTVRLQDDGGGADTSAAQSFTITLNAVNDAPTFTLAGNVQSMEDDGPRLIAQFAAQISAGPADESAQTVAFQVANSNHALFAVQPTISANGTLTYTLAANANGSATVTVSLRDDGGGADTSAEQFFTITVGAVNDPPSFAKGGDVSLEEDSGAQTLSSWATVISAGPGESDQALSFLVSSDNSALFSALPAISANGALTFTPAANAVGSATVTVRLQDDGGGADTSAAQSFTITLNGVNDAPTFTLAGNVQVSRDDGRRSIAQFAANISAGPPDESAQTVAFQVVATTPALFRVQPAISADGTLSFTPDPKASGATTMTVTATDSAGASSPAQTVEVAVTSFAEELGVYNGLALAPEGGTASAAQTGAIHLTFTSGGLMTGKIALGGVTYPFQGFVLNDGQIRFGTLPSRAFLRLPRANGLSTLQLTLALEVAAGTGKLSGEISDGVSLFAEVSADRAAYHRTKAPLPAALRGKYTFTFPARTSAQQGALAETAFPQGDGVGTMSIAAGGVVRILGTLADGRKIAATSALSKANTWPLFALTDKMRGAIAGLISVEPIAGVSDASGSDLRWFKPRIKTAVTYPNGWPGGIGVDFIGSKFQAIAGAAILPGLTVVDANGNAKLATIGGEVSPPLGATLKIRPLNQVSIVAPVVAELSLTLDAKTGLISGKFIHPLTGLTTPLHGAVLQTPARGSGFFLSPGQSGKFTVTPDSIP